MYFQGLLAMTGSQAVTGRIRWPEMAAMISFGVVPVMICCCVATVTMPFMLMALA